MGTTDAYEGWAIVELMGHRKLAGYVQEVSQYGGAMLRIDIPGADGEPAATQFYGGASIYAITPTTEAIVQAMAERLRPRPVERWELPALNAPEGTVAEFIEADDLPFD